MSGERADAPTKAGADRVAGPFAALLLAAALVLAGLAFDAPSLTVAGLAIAALVAGSVAWVEISARSLRARREPGPATVVEGEPIEVRIELRTGPLPPPGGALADPLLERPVTFGLNPPRRVREEVGLPRRGRHRLDPPTLVIRDPLRLRSREIRGEGTDGELLVLPRIEPVVASAGGGAEGSGELAEVGAEATGMASEEWTVEFELDGLRTYREGSPASRIHWPSVARTGELLERRLVGGAEAGTLIVLDAHRPADEASLDRAVRAAASLCVHLANAGGCAILLPDGRRPTEIDRHLKAWPPVHARLALVEATARPPQIAALGHQVLLIWVTAAELARPPAPVARPGAAARYVVGPRSLAGAADAFTVAGLHGQRLGVAGRRRQRPARAVGVDG